MRPVMDQCTLLSGHNFYPGSNRRFWTGKRTDERMEGRTLLQRWADAFKNQRTVERKEKTRDKEEKGREKKREEKFDFEYK